MSGLTAGGGAGVSEAGRRWDLVPASRVAQVLAAARVPVVVLNACQSGAVGKEVEAAVATRLLREGRAAVVAMAYSVYAVAAAEFMAAFYERLFAGDSRQRGGDRRAAAAVRAGWAAEPEGGAAAGRLAGAGALPAPGGALPRPAPAGPAGNPSLEEVLDRPPQAWRRE